MLLAALGMAVAFEAGQLGSLLAFVAEQITLELIEELVRELVESGEMDEKEAMMMVYSSMRNNG